MVAVAVRVKDEDKKVMAIARRANCIDDDGSQINGFFIKEFMAGLIIGSIVTNIILNVCNSYFEHKQKQELYSQNYVLPKAKTKGLYIQLDDGRLYKEQK